MLDEGGPSSPALWALQPWKYAGRTFREMYVDCLESDGVVCFALFRTPERTNKYGKRIPFVWTLPPGGTTLKANDLVYAMASKDYIIRDQRLSFDKIDNATRKIQRAVRRWLKKRTKEGRRAHRNKRPNGVRKGHRNSKPVNHNPYGSGFP